MNRPTVRRVLAICAVAAALGASCSVGVGTPPEDFVAPDEQGGANGGAGDENADVDLLVDGPRLTVQDLRAAVGAEQLRVLQLALYPDSAYLEAQRAGDPTLVDVYGWDVGEGVTARGPKDVSGVDLDAQLFGLNQVRLAAIPGLVATAPQRLGIQGDTSASVVVQRPATSPGPLITVLVSTPRGQNGALIADADGNVVATS